MITRARVSDIVNARLPEAELVDALKQLSCSEISLEILRLFIEETSGTALGKDELPPGAGLIDVSGTGGSGMAHFNTSTFCAFVLASGGVGVAKFGNRASHSGAGSADLLEALGIPLDLPPARVADVIEKSGVAFLFAPHYYPGLKRLAPARKAVGQPTIFNHIGPLLNPIDPEFRLLGISSQQIYPLMVQYLSDAKHAGALVVRSQMGVDELVPGTHNAVFHVKNGIARESSFSANGLCPFSENGGNEENAPRTTFDLAHNRNLFESLLSSGLSSGGSEEMQPWLDLVCLNAGAGFFVTGKAPSIEDGAEMAKDLICGGRVREKFDEVRRVYEKCAA